MFHCLARVKPHISVVGQDGYKLDRRAVNDGHGVVTTTVFDVKDCQMAKRGCC